MRKRWEGQMHPLTKPIIFISYSLAVIWVLWVTVIAFFGGTLPILGWEVKGGIIWGALSIACLWPVASILFFLAFQALDAFAWWVDDRLIVLFRSRNKSTDAPLNSSNSDADRLIQQSMPMIQNAANDMMAMTRDALAKGLAPEVMVDILINKLGFSKESAQTVVSDLQKEIRSQSRENESSIEDWMPADLPEWTKNMMEKTYISLVLAVGHDKIMKDMTESPINMPVNIAQEFLQGIRDQNNYDSTMAAIIASRLGKELGIPNSTEYLELLWAMVYHYRRGMSPRVIKQRAMEGHLAFGNAEFLESDIKNRLLERAIEELPTILRR